ncbi:MAG: hypothetical protein KKA79_02425 [Nanoarchaeota archaeon]|nr:hypothetical protein [Nanoarchaeota archaeon]MCG2717407.1 hypothetical protein [Nanoarchaeota archaeon]
MTEENNAKKTEEVRTCHIVWRVGHEFPKGKVFSFCFVEDENERGLLVAGISEPIPDKFGGRTVYKSVWVPRGHITLGAKVNATIKRHETGKGKKRIVRCELESSVEPRPFTCPCEEFKDESKELEKLLDEIYNKDMERAMTTIHTLLSNIIKYVKKKRETTKTYSAELKKLSDAISSEDVEGATWTIYTILSGIMPEIGVIKYTNDINTHSKTGSVERRRVATTKHYTAELKKLSDEIEKGCMFPQMDKKGAFKDGALVMVQGILFDIIMQTMRLVEKSQVTMIKETLRVKVGSRLDDKGVKWVTYRCPKCGSEMRISQEGFEIPIEIKTNEIENIAKDSEGKFK